MKTVQPIRDIKILNDLKHGLLKQSFRVYNGCRNTLIKAMGHCSFLVVYISESGELNGTQQKSVQLNVF